jgi:hypothetical protein
MACREEERCAEEEKESKCVRRGGEHPMNGAEEQRVNLFDFTELCREGAE